MLNFATRLSTRNFAAQARGGLGLAVCASVLALAGSAQAATPVQRVISPGGIEAWLMESHEVGLISLKFSFEGGALAEPADKPGVANLAGYLFNEGAGDLDSAQLTRRRQSIGTEFYAQANFSNVTVAFTAPTAYRAEAFELLGLALHRPRFDAEPIVRATGEAESALTAALKNPGSIASDQLNRKLYGPTRYAIPVMGTLESLPRITKDDIEAYRRRMFARSNLRVAVAGDIEPDELRPLLDKLFAALPDKADIGPWPVVPAQAPSAALTRMDIPQTIVMFGNLIPRLDWRTALHADIANQILSGGFTGRLFQEVREKRGLVYTIQTGRFDMIEHGGFTGAFGAGGDNAGPALEVARSEIARFLAEGPADEEVRAAKDAFLGGFYLGLDTSDKLSSQLLTMRRLGLPATYLDDFAAAVEAITTKDVHAAARILIRPDLTTTIAVGNPPAAFRIEGAAEAKAGK